MLSEHMRVRLYSTDKRVFLFRCAPRMNQEKGATKKRHVTHMQAWCSRERTSLVVDGGWKIGAIGGCAGTIETPRPLDVRHGAQKELSVETLVPSSIPFGLVDGRQAVFLYFVLFSQRLMFLSFFFFFVLSPSGIRFVSRHVGRSLPCCVFCSLPSAPSPQVACGFAYTAAVTASGELFTWGAGENGRLGLGDVEDRHTPSRYFIVLVKAQHFTSAGVHLR